MRQSGKTAEGASSPITTVLPTDTLLYALRMMERYKVRLLGVMGETGVLLGLVTEAHILKSWAEDPLLPVAEVMALCARPLRLGAGWRVSREEAPGSRECASGA
jgi:CBS domain-containing protein